LALGKQKVVPADDIESFPEKKAETKSVELETSFAKKKKELGIKTVFDLSPKSKEHKTLSKLSEQQGEEALEQYRKIYPSGSIA
jgi:hypothetical protein